MLATHLRCGRLGTGRAPAGFLLATAVPGFDPENIRAGAFDWSAILTDLQDYIPALEKMAEGMTAEALGLPLDDEQLAA